MPGKPGKVRLFQLFHYGAGCVNRPRKQRVVVGIDGCQASAGKHGGNRGLPGAGTACDLDSAHRCPSSASPEGGANEFVIPRWPRTDLTFTGFSRAGLPAPLPSSVRRPGAPRVPEALTLLTSPGPLRGAVLISSPY